jgi:hypothetical protein
MSETGDPQFLIANLSLPKPLLVAGSIAAHERYMRAIEADGMELTPMSVGHFMNRLLRRATMLEETSKHVVPLIGRDYMFDQLGYDVRKDWSYEDAAFKRLVRTQHSSFRNETDDNGILARTVPKWRDSLKHMRHIQRLTGKLWAVLYPGFENGEVVYDQNNAPFAERTFQPTISDWRRMGLAEDSSIADIKVVMAARGFTGITFDLLHCQVEREGRRFQDPLGLALRLAAAGLVRSVHLSVNRLDITGLHSKMAQSTKNSKRAFVQSAAAASHTFEGEALQAIGSEWRKNEATNPNPQGHVVVLEDGPLRLGGAKRDHTAIIVHARELAAT